MNPSKKRFFIIALLISVVNLGIWAQAPTDRQAVKQAIANWGTCRNVAITRTLGDVAIANRNDYIANYVPDLMLAKLKSLNQDGKYIDDITLTENGLWLILYDTNGVAWSAGIPESLKNAIIEFHRKDYYVRSVSVNDKGQWAIVAKEDVKTSSQELTDWLKSNCERHGELWTVTVGEEGIFAVYANGSSKRGDFPEGLVDALSNTQLDYYRVKFAGTSWFFATEDGEFEYNM